MGPMQVMPGTYEDMRRAHGLGADPHDPRDNILAGTAYLRAMYALYSYPGLFAAYNAGPESYCESPRHGRYLPSETPTYPATESPIDTGSMQSSSLVSGTRLFVTLHKTPNSQPGLEWVVLSNVLFVT